MRRKSLFKLLALVACLLCSLSAVAAEAYACYTRSNNTLTFYYDNLRYSREGTTYDLNEGYNEPGWVEDEEMFCAISIVVFDPSFANARPTSTYSWFYEQYYIMSITGLREYLNTSEVTNMAYMFFHCGDEFLKSIDLSGFNTEKVTDMSCMFSYTKLTSLDLSSFNTSKVTNMEGMFSRPYDLTTIYVSSKWSTASVTSSSNMFKNCTSLVGGMGTAYDEDHLDVAYAHIDGGTSNPGYLSDITTLEPEAYAVYTSDNTTLTFYYDNRRAFRTGTTYDLNTGYNNTSWFSDGTCTSVTQVVFDPSFADARPTTTTGWFEHMINLQDISGMNYLNTSEVTNMRFMFYGSNKLTSIDVSNFNTAKVRDMRAMFYGCSKLTSLDLSSFNTASVTDMYTMFTSCNELTTIYAGSGWSTAAVTNSSNMFYQCNRLKGSMGTAYNGDYTDASYAHIDGGTANPGYLSEKKEAYACYTPSNTTLTFYYDSQRDDRTGSTYDLNTGGNYPAWYTHRNSITQVTFDPSFADARPTSTSHWFYGMTNLQSITGMKQYLNTSEVTTMSYMFFYCSGLTNLDLSSFNTAKVTDMRVMFYYCTGLTSLNMSSFNTANVIDMSGIFMNCSGLTSLDLSNFNTAKVTNMNGMFMSCSGLTNLNVSSFNTAKVTDMMNMFFGCSGLTSLDVSNFNTAQVTNMGYMFEDCSGLTSLDVTNFNTSNATSMRDMFYYCTSLSSLDVTNFNTAKVTHMGYMFGYCSSLTTLDLSNFNTANVTDMNNMFFICRNLNTICVGSDWSTAAVTNSDEMFRSCTSLVGGKGTTYDANHIDAAYAHIDGGPSNPGYFTDPISDAEAYACYTPENTTLTFYYDGLRDSRTGTTYDMNTGTYAPGWCINTVYNSVTQVVFDPSFANARPTSTCCWFENMTHLQSITHLEYLNTSAVTTMRYMFKSCGSLTSLDMNSFNTANVIDMNGMFYYCTKLTSLDLSSFNTANVVNMAQMFRNCSKLTSVDLSSFNTSKLTNVASMFLGCQSLTSLDLSNFNTANVTYMGSMFSNSNKLVTIYVGDEWSTATVTSSADMFTGCTSLVGGRGTTYDANHVDAAYAHIDSGPSNPGYFTQGPALTRGDVNNDNEVNIADVTTLIDYLLSGNATGINLAAANCNLDDEVNIADVTTLIDYLLSGQWP